jgi:hypothetical protein
MEMDIEERSGYGSGERGEAIIETMIEKADPNGLQEGFEEIFSGSPGRLERVREAIARCRSNRRPLFRLVGRDIYL